MEHSPSFDDGRPKFDLVFAQELIGKYILVGITIEDRRGEFKRQEQFHGVVVSVDPSAGISLALKGKRDGENKWLPPATDIFVSASKGTYRLRSTGESVTDPDFTAQWLVVQPDA